MGLSANQRECLMALDRDEWLRPMDIGAWDASHHSGTLRRLVALGLVERRVRSRFVTARYAYVYRLTEAGEASLNIPPTEPHKPDERE